MNVQTNTFWVLAKFVKTKSNMNQIESRSVVFRSRSRTLGSSWKVEFGLERMPPQLGSSRAAKRCRVQSHRRHTKPRWKSHVIRLCGCGKMRSTSSSMQTCHHSRYWLVGFTDWHRHWVSLNAHQIVLHAPRNLRSVDSASVTLWFRSICNTLPISRVSRRSLSTFESMWFDCLARCRTASLSLQSSRCGVFFLDLLQIRFCQPRHNHFHNAVQRENKLYCIHSNISDIRLTRCSCDAHLMLAWCLSEL